ncbi:MAG: insulinase family protein [Alistipes sp.]|nr:insulinase family protein [Candidatus Minthomonas equi]
MTILENGCMFAFRHTCSPVAYIAVSIKTGTRDEGIRPCGLAHFTEHLIFKGTENKSATTINSCLEKLGGELNAYTSKEETVLHATVLKEDIRIAADLLLDIAFNSIFPEKEIEKERTVIIEEIKSYKDSPADQIFDDFEEILFSGTALATPVLGKTASIRKIRREDILSYWKERFIPENICITVAADLEEIKIQDMINRILQKYHSSRQRAATSNPTLCGHPSRIPIAAGGLKPFIHEPLHHHHQVHCIIGGPAYSLYQKERLPLILLTNYLGGPAANSTLNILLRERNALVYGVDTAFTQYEDTGLVTIYFGCDRENFEKCKSLIFKELSRVTDMFPSQSVLKRAKKQLLGQIAISSDNGEAQVLSMGKNLMVYGHIPNQEQIRAGIEAITPEDFRKAAIDTFNPERLSILAFR